MTATEGETCPSPPGPHQMTYELVCEWSLQHSFMLVP